MNKPFIKADEARREVNDLRRKNKHSAFNLLRIDLEIAVREAIRKQMCQATTEIPPTLDEETLINVRKGFEKLGYRVKVEKEKNSITANFLREPRKCLTIYW